MKTSPNRAIKTGLRSYRRSLKHIQSLARLNNSFMEWWALQDAHYCRKRDITEIHPATPHIDRISPFQVYILYQETLLQYFPNTWVPAPYSDISSCRNSAPKSAATLAKIVGRAAKADAPLGAKADAPLTMWIPRCGGHKFATL